MDHGGGGGMGVGEGGGARGETGVSRSAPTDARGAVVAGVTFSESAHLSSF